LKETKVGAKVFTANLNEPDKIKVSRPRRRTLYFHEFAQAKRKSKIKGEISVDLEIDPRNSGRN
jgi:hypothetical protein